jgi:hypothetical protein
MNQQTFGNGCFRFAASSACTQAIVLPEVLHSQQGKSRNPLVPKRISTIGFGVPFRRRPLLGRLLALACSKLVVCFSRHLIVGSTARGLSRISNDAAGQNRTMRKRTQLPKD